MTLPCIRCDRPLEPAFNEEEGKNQPYAGTTFESHGHFGSTIFDPMNNRDYLELNVCDDCLAQAARDGKVLHGVTIVERVTTLGPWNPDDYEDEPEEGE